MKTILIALLVFLFHQVFGKIVTDSLPNLSLPNITRFIKKSFVNIRLYFAFLTLIILAKFKKLTDHELMVLAIVTLIYLFVQNHSSKNSTSQLKPA